PLIKVGEKLELSLKNDLGFVQDLELKVITGNGQTILLNKGSNKEYSIQEEKEVQLMLKAMINKNRGKYYVREGKRVIKNKLGIETIQISTYRYGEYTGVILELTNKSNKDLPIKEQDLAYMFKGSV